MAWNAFTYLPPDVCEETDLPDFPLEQDCTSYDIDRAEIGGLIIRPYGALAPTIWRDIDDWNDGFIDNADPAASHYLVGIGTFLPLEKTTLTLAGGRVEENRERRYRLLFSVLNTDEGHADFARLLQVNKKNFTFYLQTVDGRIFAGSSGLNPAYVDADFPFGSGDARETINITIDTDFFAFPEW